MSRGCAAAALQHASHFTIHNNHHVTKFIEEKGFNTKKGNRTRGKKRGDMINSVYKVIGENSILFSSSMVQISTYSISMLLSI